MLGIIGDFVKDFMHDKHFDKVLEVGSRDVNGSIKHLFNERCNEYTGLDLIAGLNVDIVADAMDIPTLFKDETFDCVICCETLEHAKDPLRIVENMRNVLKKGGWMIITTPSIGNPSHDWPSDYYRFFETTFKDVFFKDFIGCFIESRIWNCVRIVSPNTQYPHAIFGYGQKPKD